MLIKNIEPDAQSFKIPYTEFYANRGGTQFTYVKKRETLDLIIDIPCLEACRYLFDCNILTCASSANKTHIQSNITYPGSITIDYLSLDESNKEIFRNLVEKGIIQVDDGFEETPIFNIEVPITEETTAEDFSNEMLSLAHYFKPQQILYGCYSLEEFQNYVAEKAPHAVTIEGYDFCTILLERLNRGEILVDQNGEVEFQDGKCISLDTLCQEFANEFGYFYDEEEQKYWIDKELCEKAKSVKKELPPSGPRI